MWGRWLESISVPEQIEDQIKISHPALQVVTVISHKKVFGNCTAVLINMHH
jgi:hypothetical protein